MPPTVNENKNELNIPPGTNLLRNMKILSSYQEKKDL